MIELERVINEYNVVKLLLTLPDFLAAASVLLVSVCAALAETWLVLRFSGTRLKAAYAGLVPNIGVALTAGFMLFIALIANNVLRDRTTAQEAVAAEGHALHMARNAVSAEQFPAWHAALSKYVSNVLDGEWPDMAAGIRSHAAHDALAELRGLAIEGGPGLVAERRVLLAEIVRAIDTARWHRLVAASDEVPPVLWATLFFAATIAVFFSAASHVRVPHSAYVMAVLYGLTIGAMFFAIMSLDHPFAGSHAVPATPIAERSLM